MADATAGAARTVRQAAAVVAWLAATWTLAAATHGQVPGAAGQDGAASAPQMWRAPPAPDTGRAEPDLAQRATDGRAQPGEPPLRPAEVLASSATHFPKILESLALRRAARSRIESAAGAFDLVFSSDGFGRATGYYDGVNIGGAAKRNLRPFGASVYGGYDVSTGDFPIYEDANFTNQGGRLKVGVLFSLLRDRAIDKRRFGERDALLAAREADLDVLLTRIGVQQRALVAYWRWVAAGRKLAIFEDLTRIAEDREAGLIEQVRRGARARIFVTENRQNITRRQTRATAARRDFGMAANDLAYYYRNSDGAPLVPAAGRLPESDSLANVVDPGPLPQPDRVAIDATLERRPELQKYRASIQRAMNRVALSENALRPRLDLNLELAHGLGGVGEGGPSRDATDTVVGVSFSVPLQQRVARGQLSAARAELDAMRQAQRQVEDQIEIELRNILLDLNVARELVRLAAQEVEQSKTMMTAEQRRFDSGASDFFLVNIREETAADAQIRYLRAALETRIARANFDAAMVDLPRLGID